MQAQTPTEIPKVIIYRNQLLALSETFIRQQALALRHWRPVLVGEHRLDGGLELDGLDVRLLRNPRNRLADFHYRLCRFVRLPHRPTVRKLRGVDARLIHVHFGTDAVDIWPNIRALGLPMLVTLHGYDINIHREWWEAGNGGKRRRNYPQRLLQLAREPAVRFIAVSKAIRVRAIEYGIPAEKVVVHYIGVDTEAFQPGPVPISERRKRILFVGRLVEKKGAEYLIRAFVQVHNEVPDAELVIAGDGPLRGSLMALAHSLDVPVDFLGAVSSEEVRQQMHQARVFCLPSITAGNGDAEGLPIAILEAQSCGLPVITSARGAIGEAVINGLTGVAIAEAAMDSLEDALQLLLRDRDLAETLSKQARERTVHFFDLARNSKALEDSYSDHKHLQL